MKRSKVVLLTTKTPHHYFFINELDKISDLTVIQENDILKPIFATSHFFEKKQHNFELYKWFKGKKLKLPKKISIAEVKKINHTNTIKMINLLKPNFIFSFGVSKINKKIIKSINNKIYNFHGGDITLYRGLDSHLWSLYHKDPRGLKVTLHEVVEALDAGSIVNVKKIKLNDIKNLYQLRSRTTEICLEIAKNVIKKKKLKKKISSKLGRYYSFMPRDLKDIVNKNFEKIKNDYR